MCVVRIVQIAIVSVVVALGCNALSALVATTPTPVAVAQVTPTSRIETETPSPQPTPTRTPTRTLIPFANPYSQIVSREPLSVTTTLPEHKATGIAVAKKDTVISVQFNHPVVPLVAIEAQQELPEPLAIVPQVSGRGRWVNTSTYAFVLDEDLKVATRYIVSVQPLTDLLGGSLRAYSWSFETESPQVVALDPPDKGAYVSIKASITITFNTPMDLDSVRPRLSVKRSPGQMPVPGQITTRANVLYFTPDAPLSYGTRYEVELQPGAQNAIHTALNERTISWTFETARAPGVTAEVKDGAKDVPSGFYYFQLKFTSPMDAHNIYYQVEPPLDFSNLYYYDYRPEENGFRGTITGDWQPSQTYTVTVEGRSLTRYGEQLGKDLVVHFTTAPISPNAYTIMPGAVVLYDAHGTQIVYTRHVNSREISYSLYSVDTPDLLKLLAQSAYRWELPAQARLVREWSQTVPSELNTTQVVTTTLKRKGEPQPPGAYYLEVGVDEGVTQNKILFISEFNLTLKRTENEALVWVTDLQTGKPVADQPLTLYNQDGIPLAEGKSDQDGIWRAQIPHVDSYATVWVLGQEEDRIIAAVSDNWNDDIGTWDFDLNFERTSQDLYASLYTDRAIYRPGQSVFFKGILRRDHDVDYELPSDIEKVPVRAYDSQDVQVFAQDVPLSRFGTFSGEIKLSDSAATGNYRIAIELGDKPKSIRTTPFLVAAYRPPDYFVTVQTQAPAYVSGDTIKSDVDASYFFGGSVGNATVRWLVESQEMYFRPPNVEGDWEFQEYMRPSYDTVRQGEGKTDAQGKFQFDVPADLAHHSNSQSYTVQAEITDINHQAISNRTVVPVHRGKFYIGVRPDRYIGVAGQKQSIEAITVDPQGITVTQQSIVVSIYHRRWFSTLYRDADGYFSWESTYTETLASKINVTTNGRGYASTPFVPTAGGAYHVIVEGKDDIGNPIRSATYFWVSDSDFVDWEMKNNDRIELIADKKEYTPGDVAEIMIPAPFKDAEALITAERGSIRDVWQMTLKTNSDRVQIPIQSDYAPNIFISVVLVKGRGADSPISQFKLGYVKLPVSRTEKALDVKVTADRSTPYSPGDKATFTIQATDHAGQGVEAEFSVALVDKAVQSLADDRSVPPLDAFYGERGLAVQTSTTLVRSVDRVNYDLQTGKKGGGGGEYAVTTTRRDFRDTAFWQADVVTDSSGRAQVTIPLPDNLTTWNLTAKGVTAATEVGVASTDILSTKEFLLRPTTPRFFVVGDKVRLEAAVHNNTPQEVRATVQLDAQGLTLRSNAEQSLTLTPRGKAIVSWEVTVNAVERAVVRFNARGGALQDAVELTLPVHRPIASETVATAGQIETQVAEQIDLPKTIDPSAGELNVELSPSLAAASRSGLRYLESYEYDCVEQVTSKFLPNVASYLALKELGIERADLRQNLESNVQRETQRLNALQHRDGGWGWWWDGESDPALTAYALYGLHTAKRAGFAVDPAVLDRAEDYVMRYLDESIDPTARLAYNQRAFVIFVLAEMGRPMTGRAVSLFDQRARLGNYGKAWLLMALGRLEQPQVSALRSELTSKAIVSATGAHWEETEIDYWTMNTNTRSTALAIMALARTDPKNMTLPGAVRWLMTARKKGHWETTQETAWSVLALTEFMRSTGELNGNYHFQATLNGKTIGEGVVDSTNVDQSTALQVAVKDLLLSTANTLILSRDSGDGRLYYSAYLNYYLPAENVPAVNRGIIVTRQYEAVDPNTLRPTGKMIESAKAGDYVRVTLTVIAPNDLHYLALEDPLPAGFEAVDRSLNTANIAAHAPMLQAIATARNWFKAYWEYWTHSEVRDDRVVAFATYLERGTYQYSYLARASIAGEFRVLPARASEMYFPDVFGHSSGALFTVKRE